MRRFDLGDHFGCIFQKGIDQFVDEIITRHLFEFVEGCSVDYRHVVSIDYVCVGAGLPAQCCMAQQGRGTLPLRLYFLSAFNNASINSLTRIGLLT
jgi:hypothetical protein